MSFSLWTMACEGIGIGKSGSRLRHRAGRMHPQSTDGSVLGLHSCRALSPKPQGQTISRLRDKKAPKGWKKAGLGLMQSVLKSIEQYRPKDQLCNCKLRPCYGVVRQLEF